MCSRNRYTISRFSFCLIGFIIEFSRLVSITELELHVLFFLWTYTPFSTGQPQFFTDAGISDIIIPDIYPRKSVDVPKYEYGIHMSMCDSVLNVP